MLAPLLPRLFILAASDSAAPAASARSTVRVSADMPAAGGDWIGRAESPAPVRQRTNSARRSIGQPPRLSAPRRRCAGICRPVVRCLMGILAGAVASGLWPIDNRLGGAVHRAGAAEPPTVIRESTTWSADDEPGPLVIETSNIVIDGGGALIRGPGGERPNLYQGTGIVIRGARGVTLRNLRVEGFETGLRMIDCEECRVEQCDFSDNFHDPGFGWGEQGRRGGLVLERCRGVVLHNNRANRVWDGCVLVDSDDNQLSANDFSHTSNTGLKLWHASGNLIRDNVLSHGLRKDPGEVHARDSTCVLIESGSNDNRFLRNDCTHGGDGIFVRVLNGWVSTGNLFEENDCSYANNNGFEAWSPRNSYRRNRANHCSYGFWLGASDQTVLIDNEASYNGLATGHHNSPHLPDAGHAGIVFMFGPSSHTVLRGNRCVGNRGAGIALIGDQPSRGGKFKAYHWVVEQNVLEHNTWGIFAQYADWLDLAGNRMRANLKQDFHDAGGVTRVTYRSGPPPGGSPPVARLRGPALARVGEEVKFEAGDSHDPAGARLEYAWDLGDGQTATRREVTHVYREAGFQRVALTVSNRRSADLAWHDLYVVDDLPEPATEEGAGQWSWNDAGSQVTFHDDVAVRIAGRTSLRAEARPYSGGRLELVHRPAGGGSIPLEGKSELVFWIRTRNENIPAWQGENPLVTLGVGTGTQVTLTPPGDLLSQPPVNEAREGWQLIRVPLRGGGGWKRTGELPARVEWLAVGVDSWGAPPLQIWLDGLAWR